MNPTNETATPKLDETTLGGKDSFAKVYDSKRTDNDNESTPERSREAKRRLKGIPIGDHPREGPQEGNSPARNIRPNAPTTETPSEMQGHLPGEKGTLVISVQNQRSKLVPTAAAAPYFSPRHRQPSNVRKESVMQNPTNYTVEELKKQNFQLLEALMKIQKIHAADKKRFHEVLFGIDRALSSLPIRLEKIRVRNQKNLSMLKSSRLHSGDGNENVTEESACESLPSSDNNTAETSHDGQAQVSSRMKSLLNKIDQLNDLISNIHEGDASPIELLVNSELYAISLLKKEIKSTKKQIDDNRTDTETVVSLEGSQKITFEESSSKAKNPFSNELNKASNFKIFENHMMLQEEALNLLTRKIKETEEALLKEVEAKEGLKRENETMAKEIFRLKSAGEEPGEEKSLKTEKLKLEPEATGNRPYRLIKELRAKLEEKEKALIAWKSKYARLETTNANKANLLENERKRNMNLEAAAKNLQIQNKSMSTQISSLQFLNDQLRNQLQILRHQVEILATQQMEELNALSQDPRVNEIISKMPLYKKKLKEAQKEGEKKLEDMKNYYESQLEEVRFQLLRHQGRSEEFADTFKELLIMINHFGMEKDLKNVSNPTYDKIREILHITPSDLELLFSVYAKSIAEEEIERLYADFRTIIDGDENEFSETLSAWFFDLILDKMFNWGSEDKISKLILA